MNYTIKHYVEYCYPGIVSSDYSQHKIESRDINKLDIPKMAYAFRFYDIYVSTINVEGKDIKFKSERMNESGYYFIDGTVYTKQEVIDKFSDKTNVIYNMNQAGWDKIVVTSSKQWIHFNEGDQVI